MKTPEEEIIEAELGAVRLLRTAGRTPELRAVAAAEESKLMGRLAKVLRGVAGGGSANPGPEAPAQAVMAA